MVPFRTPISTRKVTPKGPKLGPKMAPKVVQQWDLHLSNENGGQNGKCCKVYLYLYLQILSQKKKEGILGKKSRRSVASQGRRGRSMRPKQTSKKQYKTAIFKIVAFGHHGSFPWLLDAMLAHFGEVLGPKRSPKTSKNWS